VDVLYDKENGLARGEPAEGTQQRVQQPRLEPLALDGDGRGGRVEGRDGRARSGPTDRGPSAATARRGRGRIAGSRRSPVGAVADAGAPARRTRMPRLGMSGELGDEGSPTPASPATSKVGGLADRHDLEPRQRPIELRAATDDHQG
jgi:hypothetical protein